MTAVTDRDHLLVTFVQGSLDLVWRQVYVVYQAGLLWIAEETTEKQTPSPQGDLSS
jgi:hypothetical protein